jgi:hypothetical protein
MGGSLGHAATLRFPSPLIEPDVRISRIRLSGWLYREGRERNYGPQASSVRMLFFLRLKFLTQSRVSNSTAISQDAKLNSHGGGRGPSFNMRVILSDLLLFGCIAACATWLIIEVANCFS